MRAPTVLVTLLCAASITTLAQTPTENQNEQLRAQVEELEARLADVEQRLGRIEKTSKDSSATPSAVLPPETQRWRSLSKSMSRAQVKQLLGEPLRIEGGPFEYWYYSKNGSSGPHVRFYQNRVY